MSDRGTTLGGILALVLTSAACGHPEQRVVDQYFGAVNQNDNQTLASFAVVRFDKKVDKWRIEETRPEVRAAATLPDLVKKVKDTDTQMAENKKAAGAYRNDHFAEVDQIRASKDGKVPAHLQAIKTEWDKFELKDRELKKAMAEAKEAVEKEKRDVTLSVGPKDDVESLKGEVISKELVLTLTIAGQPQTYVMGLRKYELASEKGGGRVVNRWVIHTLTPKG